MLCKLRITRIIQGPAGLMIPPDAPNGQVWRYGLGFPFQVVPRMAGMFVNVEVECTENYGFLNGTDVVLFDDLSAVHQGRTVAITRNEICRNLETRSDELILQSPMIGGFVPLGAKREDGAPHPHAGTGFGIAQAHIFPGYKDGRFIWWEPGRHDLLKVVQLSYDGEQFRRAHDSVYSQNTDSPLSVADSGWHIISHGLTSAIPHGDDLLLPVLAGRVDGTDTGVDVARRQLDPPIVVRNATAEFGPPPALPDPKWVEAWILDHPNAGTVRLADGRWYHLLVYRIKHSPLCHLLKTIPAPQVGCYIDEVISSGPTVPGWNFGQQEG